MGIWSYYLFMGLLIMTLVLWAIVALRDDGQEPGDTTVKRDAEDAPKEP